MRVVVGGYAARTTALLVADRTGAASAARGVRLRWWGSRSRMRSFTRRGFAVATVDGVRVVVLHLSLDPVERRRHLTRILAELPPVDAAGGRCVVMGDLNEQPGGEVWTRLGARLQDAAADRPEPTFPAGRPRQRIDAVLVDLGTTVVGVHVPDGEPVTRASDHRPVVVDLAVSSG
jgi:endonuclease/exonuclease/phosphatase family metal-dependent hydrolase